MSLSFVSSDRWQDELVAAYTNIDQLYSAGILTFEETMQLRTSGITREYKIRIPHYYANLMDQSAAGRSTCPIRKQALPSFAESDPVLPPWAQEWSIRAFGREQPWTADPIGDLTKLAAPRLTHRYGNRAILHLSSMCALYCRFCFRKSHLNDKERPLYEGTFDAALDYLHAHEEIRELILTGGDPLSLPDAWLRTFFKRLESIQHLKQVRVHSRMAVTLPTRLTDTLAEIFANSRFQVALVSHFNHPKELTNLAQEKLRILKKQGITLLNQSVLLKSVNDDPHTLYQLFQNLYESGVIPFYLHHPDWTPGTFHFRVPISRGQEIMDQLAGRLSGPALPDYVLDIPGGMGKTSLLGNQTKIIETHSADELSGALYEVRAPLTRSKLDAAGQSCVNKSPVLYAEFWKEGFENVQKL